MTATKESVDRFYEFARRKLEAADAEVSWDELLTEWLTKKLHAGWRAS